MASTINDSWETIQAGVQDVERLIGQKEYNTSMIKARQTLEYMVKLLVKRAGIGEEEDLKNMIDTLYQYHWIKKSTCEHYHKIRIIGNQAVHDGNASPYDANLAHHMLSQEVYTFANDYRNAGRGSRPARSAKNSSGKRSSSASTRSRRRQNSSKRGFTLYDLLRLMVPILCIILLFCIVKLLRPSDTQPAQTAPVATVAETETAAVEVTEATPVLYRVSPSMSTSLNVRSEPNTDHEPVGRLSPGAEVEYVRAHDDDWAVILYNGQEAYVSSQYLITE